MLFSVIVPIYKVEKYIERCVDSVRDQSFADWELILVDDGSPDRCPAICDAYAAQDTRVRVIHKANGGLVSARQAGMQVAEGEYVIHLDGDDALCADALQRAAAVVQDTRADIVCFSYRRYEGGCIGEPIDEPLEAGLYDRVQVQHSIFPKLLVDENMEHVFYYLWGKAIKRELAAKHQAGVNPAISLGEDLSCMVPCYLDACSVYVSREVVYLYTIRDDSISTDFKTGQITQIEDVIRGLRVLTADKPADFEAQIARYSCFMCFAILAAAAEGDHAEVLGEIEQRIRDSVHREEIPKARFARVSAKSRIAIWLLRGLHLRAAYHFLHLCKQIKRFKEGTR